MGCCAAGHDDNGVFAHRQSGSPPIFRDGRRDADDLRFFIVRLHGVVDIPGDADGLRRQKIRRCYNQGNPVFDYVWNTVRRRFGGRMHARNDGIKPFIQSVRQGYWGYYLPDQDQRGSEFSSWLRRGLPAWPLMKGAAPRRTAVPGLRWQDASPDGAGAPADGRSAGR
jgi:hypothetical protein